MTVAERFDFRAPLPVPASATRLVEQLLEAAPRVGMLLGLACGRPVTVSCAGASRVAVAGLTTAGLVWAPLACGLPEPALLLLAAEDAVALADLLLGGSGESEQRRALPLEQGIVVHHVVPALRPLADTLVSHGVRPLVAGEVSDEPLPAGFGEVLAVPLDVALPAGGTARVTLCLPAKSLLPAEPEHRVPAIEPATAAALADVPVFVSLRLPPVSMPADEVDNLAAGDVLRLDPGATDELLGLLAGPEGTVPLLRASLGRRGRRRAVVVHELLGDNE